MAWTDARELLNLWEAGHGLPPARLAMLLAGEDAADLPVGAANARLFGAARALTGPVLEGVADCPSCGERLDVAVPVADFLALPAPEPWHVMEVDGAEVRFRLPSWSDLAALPQDGAEAALLERCAGALSVPAGPVIERMAALDPLADAELALTCDACGHAFARALDIAQFLWRAIDARATKVLTEVHLLARAYGWPEADILALTPLRRQAYLEMAGA